MKTYRCLAILLLFLVAGGTLHPDDTPAPDYAPGYGPVPFIGGVRFRYHFPGAASVAVAGDFNNWTPTVVLTPLRDGAFEGILPAASIPGKGKIRYKLVVDGIWQPDPFNERREYDLAGDMLSWFSIPSRLIAYSRDNPEKTGPTRYRFIYHNPAARTVRLAGSFNGYDPYSHSMERDSNGVWTIEAQVLPGPHAYCFIVDGEWIIDPLRVPVVHTRFGRRFSSFTAR